MKSSPDPSHHDLSLVTPSELSAKSVTCYAAGSGLLALALAFCDVAPTAALLLAVLGLLVFGAS